MKKIRISAGGQISLPAEVRRRWATDSLVIEDFGDRVVVRPMPENPVRSARGSLSARGGSSSAARARLRREESRSEKRKYRR